MEGDEQRRRQYEQSQFSRGYVADYGVSGTNVSNIQQLRGVQGAENTDRFRQGQILSSRTPASASLNAGAGAGAPQDIGAFPYSQGQQYQASQLQPGSYQYPPEYVHDTQRPRYQQYSSQVMYPSTQSPYHMSQQAQIQSPYDPVGQYQPRQAAVPEALSTPFGVPSQYYSVGDVPNVPAPAAIPQEYQAAAYHQSTQYNSSSNLGRSTLTSPYPSTPAELSQVISNAAPTDQGTDVAAENNSRYYRAIGETNANTARGMLVQAGDSLMQITEWLLTNAVRLGFTKDDQAMHAQRLALWDNFNNCWLALLQRQLDDTNTMLRTGRGPHPPQTLLPVETLESMGDELVAYCDNLGRVGLVDYQMGVSEEEIIDILRKCIDLRRNSDDDDDDNAEAGLVANPQRRRRGG